MILTAGLSPAWQQMLCVSELAVGQVNRAKEAHWSSSGKVLNVALALHHLGADVSTLAVLGGPEGERVLQMFDGALPLWKGRLGGTWSLGGRRAIHQGRGVD